MAISTYLLCVSFFAGLGTFTYGFDTGIMTTTIGHPSWQQYMNHPSEGLVGAVASLYITGELIGAIIQIFIGDRFGRKGFLTFCCCMVTLGTCTQTGSQGMGSFLAGRSLAGVGVGGFLGTVTVYLNELSVGHHRGMITGISGCALSFGVMVSNWVGLGCSFLPFGEAQWRIPLAMQIPWGLILLVGLWTFMPESPRHLVRRGKISEAKHILQRASGNSLSTYETDHEFETMVARIQYEATQSYSYAEIFRSYRHRALVSIGVGVWTMTTGPAVILYYQSILYKGLGLDTIMVMTLAGVYGTIGFISNTVNILWVGDRLGRRPAFLIGLATISAVLIYTAIMSWRFAASDSTVGKGFTILGIYLFAVCFNGFLNSPALTYTSEVCPLEIRSKVVGMSTMAHFSTNIVLTEAGPTALATIKQNYYYVFVGCSLVAMVFIYLYYPETRDKTLEEIGVAFGDKPLDVGPGHIENVDSVSEKTSADRSVRLRDV